MSAGKKTSQIAVLQRLHTFNHVVERMVKLAVLRNTTAKDRLKISEIRDVDDFVDTVHEGAHGVIGGKPVTQ